MDTIVGWVVLLALAYWWYRRRKNRASSATDLGSNASPRGAVSASGSGKGDVLKAGRAKLPGKKWICTRCEREFSISVDPKTIPRMWWIPSNNEKGNSPWACPDCGTYAYTVPRD
jgi:hypothetical protein